MTFTLPEYNLVKKVFDLKYKKMIININNNNNNDNNILPNYCF